MKQNQGVFLSIEGPDGSGKSTNVKLLIERLKERGYHVVSMREPGGSPVSEKIRELALHEPTCLKTEILLFAAQRAQNLDSIILPALKHEGWVVVSDRFHDSTYAYQGCGRGGIDDVLAMEKFVMNGFEPTFTLFFDVTLEESIRRLNIRTSTNGEKKDLFEQEQEEFHAAVYHGYKDRLLQNPHRMHRINGMQTPPEVAQDVLAWVDQHFPARN